MIVNLRTWGPQMWRSGRLNDATPEEVECLQEMLRGGIIIDLRTPGRAAKEPDPVLEDVERITLPLPPTAYVGYDVIMDQHRRVFFHAASEIVVNRPVLVHCSEGKDRTGMIVAVLQMWGGIPVTQARDEFIQAGGVYPDWKHIVLDPFWTTYRSFNTSLGARLGLK